MWNFDGPFGGHQTQTQENPLQWLLRINREKGRDALNALGNIPNVIQEIPGRIQQGANNLLKIGQDSLDQVVKTSIEQQEQRKANLEAGGVSELKQRLSYNAEALAEAATGAGWLDLAGMALAETSGADWMPEALRLPLLIGGISLSAADGTPPPLSPKQLNRLSRVSSTAKRLTSGQQKLLRHLTPEAIAEISDPSLKMMYEKAAKMLHTPGLSTRNAQAVLQTGPNSGLIKALEGVDNPEVMDSVITSYFTRNPLYFSGGYGFNLDHLVPLSSTAKLATKVKPAVFQEALALQLKKFGRSFGHDQEFSLIPRRTHAAKHTGTPEIGDLSPDWKTKYLDEIIDSVPENASVEQVNEALSQMYDKSLYHTGQALQSKEFFSIREGVLESLPSRVRKALGPNFDITGRTADPVKWKLFLGHLRQAPGEVKQAIREISQVRTLELKDVKKFNP